MDFLLSHSPSAEFNQMVPMYDNRIEKPFDAARQETKPELLPDKIGVLCNDIPQPGHMIFKRNDEGRIYDFATVSSIDYKQDVKGKYPGFSTHYMLVINKN